VVTREDRQATRLQVLRVCARKVSKGEINVTLLILSVLAAHSKPVRLAITHSSAGFAASR